MKGEEMSDLWNDGPLRFKDDRNKVKCFIGKRKHWVQTHGPWK